MLQQDNNNTSRIKWGGRWGGGGVAYKDQWKLETDFVGAYEGVSVLCENAHEILVG